MNKIFVVLSAVLLTSMVAANGGGSNLWTKFYETECWYDYATDEDGLAGFVYFDYYEEEFPPYFEQYVDELSTTMGELELAADTGDVTEFMTKLSEVMNLVRKIQSSFWKESIIAIIGGYDVGEIADFYSDANSDLNECLANPEPE